MIVQADRAGILPLPMSSSMIRQADPLISADDALALGLDRERLLAMFRNMLLTRGIEERGNLLFKAGKLPGSYYTGRGNEAASVGAASAMGEHDVASPLHRNMGVHVTRGVDLAAIFCQFMGRSGGATGGRDSNLRTNDLSPGRGLLAGVSHLPAMIPVITGIALAFQLRGEPRVALGWCGDGAAARGDMHEAMNLAGVRRLPIVYIIDNNQYAYSTPNRLSFASTAPGRPRPGVRLRGHRRRRHRRPHRLPRGQPCGREGARRAAARPCSS